MWGCRLKEVDASRTEQIFISMYYVFRRKRKCVHALVMRDRH